MTDEEKKAIEYWQYIRDTQIYDGYKGQVYAVELLSLIEKQSKEIEELKDEYNIKLLSNTGIYQLGFNDGIKSVEDKIKAKIEEVEQWELYNMKIPRLSTLDERLGAKIGIKYVLQSLLEKE